MILLNADFDFEPAGGRVVQLRRVLPILSWHRVGRGRLSPGLYGVMICGYLKIGR